MKCQNWSAKVNYPKKTVNQNCYKSMGTTKRTDDILAGLELALYEVLKPENLNVWVSVRTRSITGILKDAGVDMNFSSAFLEELRNVGLIETDSCGAGMKYMVKTDHIPDVKFLVKKIYDNHKARYAKGRVNDGYPSSDKRDLRPKVYGKKGETQHGESGPVKIIPTEVARLGDVGYVVRDSVIYECMVIGIAYDTSDRKRILYTVECYRGKSAEGEDIYNVISNVGRKEFHRNVESALAAIHIFKYVKRK